MNIRKFDNVLILPFLARTAILIALTVLIVYAVMFLQFSGSLISYKYDWEESDGNVILAGKMLSQGRSFYADPLQFPMFPYVYPPVYPAVIYSLTRVFGETTGIARAMSLVATIGIVIMIYVLVRGQGSSRTVSLAASLLIFSFPEGARWLTSAKPDAMFCLLLLLGFASLSRALSCDAAWQRLAVPLILFLAAAFTKHAGLTAAVAAAFVLFMHDRRRGLVFSACFGILFLLTLYLLELWSGGWFFRDVFSFAAHVTEISPIGVQRLLWYSKSFLYAYWIPLSCALISLALLPPVRTSRVWPVFLGISIFLAVQSGRNGLSHNHFLPLAISTSIVFCTSIESAKKRWAINYPATVAATAIAISALFLGSLFLSRDRLKYYEHPSADAVAAWENVVDFIRKAPGPVLVDYAPSASLVADKWDNTTDSCNLMFSGLDPGPVLLPLVNRQHFAAIVLYGHTYFPEEIINAVQSRYRVVAVAPVSTSEVELNKFVWYFVPNESSISSR